MLIRQPEEDENYHFYKVTEKSPGEDRIFNDAG